MEVIRLSFICGSDSEYLGGANSPVGGLMSAYRMRSISRVYSSRFLSEIDHPDAAEGENKQ